MSTSITNIPQPTPIKIDGKPIYELVIQDLQNRSEMGKKKYGQYLTAHNGRNPLIDSYQEAMDLTQYLRQAIIESDCEPYDFW